jgi:hypothetical protein
MLSFVICGIEHSGTTLLSDLFRQVGGLDSGFECGVLLCRSPREFPNLQPFFGNILNGWKIDEAALRACCETDDFSEFYRQLAANSKVLDESVNAIFDKTPRYLSVLSECLSRTPAPFLCTYKDPRAIVYSDMSRAKPASFEAWYDTYFRTKKVYLAKIYAEITKRSQDREQRVLTIRLEDVCLNARETLERAFAFVGLRFSPHYVAIENKRYAHNRDNSISARIPFEYRLRLTRKQIATIERDFSAFAHCFYD